MECGPWLLTAAQHKHKLEQVQYGFIARVGAASRWLHQRFVLGPIRQQLIWSNGDGSVWKLKLPLNSSFCAVTAHPKSRWLHRRKAYFRGVVLTCSSSENLFLAAVRKACWKRSLSTESTSRRPNTQSHSCFHSNSRSCCVQPGRSVKQIFLRHGNDAHEWIKRKGSCSETLELGKKTKPLKK